MARPPPFLDGLPAPDIPLDGVRVGPALEEQTGVRRDQRKEKVDKMAAAILLQSYLDEIA